jgi:hypothetical protein
LEWYVAVSDGKKSDIFCVALMPIFEAFLLACGKIFSDDESSQMTLKLSCVTIF